MISFTIHFLFFLLLHIFAKSISCGKCGDEPFLGRVINPIEIREHPWSPYTLLKPEDYPKYTAFAAYPSNDRGFMSIFKNIISQINEELTEKQGTAPLVIWGRNNYNAWEYDKEKQKWYQNASTGYGIHNLWTYLFIPFNFKHYQNDSQYLRVAEEQIYTNSAAHGFIEKGLWITHRLHPRIMVPFMNFYTPYRHHFRIGVHFRGTDRSNEINSVYRQIIDAAKLIHSRAIEDGAKKIVFFLSSDDWSQIKRGREDLRETGAEITYMPNIARSSTDIAIHLQHSHLPDWIRYFLMTEKEEYSDFLAKCIRTQPELWKNIFNTEANANCQTIADQKKVRPSFLLAVDSLLETIMIAHSHFYVSMGGNFATGPHMLFNALPSIQFLTPHVTTEEHPNMVKVPSHNTRPLIWPCPFEEYMKRVIQKLNWEIDTF
jgi:hypothetical protein